MTRAAPHLRKPSQSLPVHRRLRPALQGDTAAGTFAGYGSVFGVLDDHGTVMLPGCFAASLEAHRAAGTMPKMLWQHMPEFPVGAWSAMSEDETGLWCDGALILDVEKAREAHALLKAEAIDGLSVGFNVADGGIIEVSPEEAEADYGVDISSGYTMENGLIGLFTAVELWECSLVTFQSCPDAVVETVRTTKADPGLQDLTDALAARSRAVTALLSCVARRSHSA